MTSAGPALVISLCLTVAACSGAPVPSASPARTSESGSAASASPAASSPAAVASASASPAATVAPSATAAPSCPPVDEAEFDANQIVPATANIFGAGRDIGPAPGGGGRGSVPPVWELPDGAGRTVTIACAAGSVIPIRDYGIANGAAGDHTGWTDVSSFEGISGIVHGRNGMFLVGVFLTDAEPAYPEPERLDFTDSEDFEVLAPDIGQTFFVGDGRGRRFTAPPDATRLFLGFADAAGYRGPPGWYGNNAGELSVTVEVTAE